MSSFALRMIAIVTMLIDHIGLVFHHEMPDWLFWVMRGTGRLAMPIFCFLIAEGLLHTRDVRKYLSRLLIFGVVSELPFDLMLNGRTMMADGTLFDFAQQNVMFTLFLGLLGIMLFDTFAARNQRLAALAAIVAAGVAAQLLNTDYGMFGVYYVFVFYFFRGQRGQQTVFFALGLAAMILSQIMGGASPEAAAIQMCAIAALIPISHGNGRRGPGGKAMRFGFYAFYPAHMLLLFGLCYLISG